MASGLQLIMITVSRDLLLCSWGLERPPGSSHLIVHPTLFVCLCFLYHTSLEGTHTYYDVTRINFISETKQSVLHVLTKLSIESVYCCWTSMNHVLTVSSPLAELWLVYSTICWFAELHSQEYKEWSSLWWCVLVWGFSCGFGTACTAGWSVCL